MYTVAVIEDERLINNKIKLLLDQIPDVKIVGQYTEGIQALISFEQNGFPDIVVSDINMPKLNGLEVSRCIRNSDVSTQIILVSGYAEFEYAHTALEMEINSYLLKPIKKQELQEAIDKCIQNLNGQQHKISSVEKERHVIRHWMFGHQNHSFRNSKSGLSRDELKYEYYAVFLVYFCLNFQSSYSELSVILNSKFLGAGLDFFNLSNEFDDNRCYVVLYGNDEELLKCACQETALQVTKLYKNQVKICYSVRDKANIRTMAAENETYFMNRFIFDQNIYCCQKTQMNRAFVKQMLSELHTSFISTVDHPQKFTPNLFTGELEAIIERLFSADNLEKCGCEAIKMLFQKFFLMFQWALNSYSDDFSEIVPRAFLTGDALDEIDNNNQLLHFMINSVTDVFKPDSIKHNSKLVNQAIQLINENYQDPEMSLMAISEKLYVSSSYLSRIFKEEIGDNFNHYFNQVKIGKAQRLLTSTNYDIVDISLDVGYNSQQYFTKVFKKLTGETPMSYRNRHRQNERNG